MHLGLISQIVEVKDMMVLLVCLANMLDAIPIYWRSVAKPYTFTVSHIS